MFVLHNNSLRLTIYFCSFTVEKIELKILASLSLFPYWIPRLGIARKMATSDWIVLLYTTGLYCLKSSGVNPLSWIILENKIPLTPKSLSTNKLISATPFSCYLWYQASIPLIDILVGNMIKCVFPLLISWKENSCYFDFIFGPKFTWRFG